MLAQVLLASVFTAVFPVTVGHRLECSSEQFRCFNGKCIERGWFCDGENDCVDNSDEKFCDVTTCPTEDDIVWFRCGKRRCIPSVWQCDKVIDCPDESDEISCGTTFDKIPAIPGVSVAAENLVEQFMKTRQNTRSTNKWGPHLLRTAVALFLKDPGLFEPENTTGDEIAYELSLQMMSKLALGKNVSTHDLALFINAMTVSCIDPKDFYSVDLVAALRFRVDSSDYSNPFFILTLCNAGDNMTLTDVLKLNSTFYARLRPVWTDMEALATMAMSCISSRSDLNVEGEMLKVMATELKTKQSNNSSFGNLRTTAVVMQALISTGTRLADTDLVGAIKYVLRELNDTTVSFYDMYYVLPLLNSKSLVNISSEHCVAPVITELEVLKKLQDHEEERVQARVSVFIGNELDFVRTWQLKVPPNSSFYQVLETIGAIEPAYKVHYSMSEDEKPYVTGVSIFFDDVEDGMFWFLYIQNLNNATEPKLVEESPVDIQLNEDEELILWYRSEVWIDS